MYLCANMNNVVGLDDKPPISDITLSDTQDSLPNLSMADINGIFFYLS